MVDLKLPGKNGLELQAELIARGSTLSIVIITAHGDVASARAALRSKAVDFLEKPFEEADLRAAIDTALQSASLRTARAAVVTGREAQSATLTSREREILVLVGKGLHAKEVAAALDISPRTVEVHRAHLMTKLMVRNTAELVRFALMSERDVSAE